MTVETAASIATFAHLITQANARSRYRITVYGDDGAELALAGNKRAVQCATEIAHSDWTDARWALEVLNRFGHLVPHSRDEEGRVMADSGETASANTAYDAALALLQDARQTVRWHEASADASRAIEALARLEVIHAGFELIHGASSVIIAGDRTVFMDGRPSRVSGGSAQ
jgi:hypothetical protein